MQRAAHVTSCGLQTKETTVIINPCVSLYVKGPPLRAVAGLDVDKEVCVGVIVFV